MTLPRTASSRRTNPPRTSDYSKSFRNDWQRLSNSGRFDLKRLKEVMLLLIANDGPLGPEWQDHALSGAWATYRECHAGGDFLLIYRVDGKTPDDSVVFVRAGTHADLFE